MGDMVEERTQYRERTPWPGWVAALMWGAIVLAGYPLLAGWDTTLPLGPRLMIVAGIVGLGAAARVLLGGLTVLVQKTRIVLHLGSVPVVRRHVPLADVLSTESVRYRPIREFGGWGVRGWGRRKAWSARGDRAVALRLTRDRELLIGSDRPQRLEERIRAAMRAAGGGASEAEPDTGPEGPVTG